MDTMAILYGDLKIILDSDMARSELAERLAQTIVDVDKSLAIMVGGQIALKVVIANETTRPQ